MSENTDAVAARRQQDEEDAPELLAALMQLQTELTQELDTLRSSNTTEPRLRVIEEDLLALKGTEAQLRGRLRSARWMLAHLRQKQKERGRA